MAVWLDSLQNVWMVSISEKQEDGEDNGNKIVVLGFQKGMVYLAKTINFTQLKQHPNLQYINNSDFHISVTGARLTTESLIV